MFQTIAAVASIRDRNRSSWVCSGSSAWKLRLGDDLRRCRACRRCGPPRLASGIRVVETGVTCNGCPSHVSFLLANDSLLGPHDGLFVFPS